MEYLTCLLHNSLKEEDDSNKTVNLLRAPKTASHTTAPSQCSCNSCYRQIFTRSSNDSFMRHTEVTEEQKRWHRPQSYNLHLCCYKHWCLPPLCTTPHVTTPRAMVMELTHSFLPVNGNIFASFSALIISCETRDCLYPFARCEITSLKDFSSRVPLCMICCIDINNFEKTSQCHVVHNSCDGWAIYYILSSISFYFSLSFLWAAW